MRISLLEKQFIKNYWQRNFPHATVFLFGSRADDNQKGGDIDILVINDEKISLSQKKNFLAGFIREVGEQKVDLVTYTYSENPPFKRIALEKAIRL